MVHVSVGTAEGFQHVVHVSVGTAEGFQHVVHVSVGTFPCVLSGDGRSIVPEVLYQRVVVQLASTCNLAEWAISSSGRFRARGTCVRGNIFMRMEGNWSVGHA